MAIHIQEEQNLQQGHLKSIDEAGIMMVFDTLQKYQYSYPVKSTVRELLSNGVDSISEKKVAKEILTGTAKVEDYFVELEGALYKDSRFDPSYYDLKWLSNDDIVTITYSIGGAFEKDKVIFRDNGVGLFGKRLEGYFKLAYSTKRLSKLPLGKFGLGAKSPLSVGVEFYTVESRYNGMLFRFNVYSSKVDSIIPRLNMETGQENQHVVFNEGQKGTNDDGTQWSNEYLVYWIPTTEKNGLTITVEAKKHHKQQYIDAVKSQMLYFDNIKLLVDTGGIVEEIDYKAKILYEDDLIVMSDNSYYSKPHLLLNKVNYGYIAWDELELEEKNGNIGIKVQPEDVEVNPSRESVLWTEKTKNKVLARFNQVVDVASEMIQKELQATDIIVWLKTCYSTYSRYSERSGIIGRLAKIVDLSRAKFKFLPDERIVFDAANPFPGIFMRSVNIVEEKDATKLRKRKVIRTEIESLTGQLHRKIYLMHKGERAVNRRDKWLFQQNNGAFITIMEPYGTLEEAEKDGIPVDTLKKLYKGKTQDRMAYWEALIQSAEVVWYDKVEVPEEFTGNDTETETVVEKEKENKKEQEATEKTVTETNAMRRKKQGKILIYPVLSTHGVKHVEDDLYKAYDFYKLEVPVASINDWKAKEIYYGFDGDSELMNFIAFITREQYSVPGKPIRKHATNVDIWQKMKWWRLNKHWVLNLKIHGNIAYQLQHFFDTDVMLVKTSQANAKYFRDFSYVQEFFVQIENKTISMSNKLIQWNTARLVRNYLPKASFLFNFPFNSHYADLYSSLCAYVDRHFRSIDEHNNIYGVQQETYTDMISHLDKVRQFQEFVAHAPNDHEGIGALAGQLFGNKDLRDGMAVELSILQQAKELTEYADLCGPLFNHIPVLTGYNGLSPMIYPLNSYSVRGNKSVIPDDLEQDIRMQLASKNLLDMVPKSVQDAEISK